MFPAECLSTLKSQVEFLPVGETTGNLTVGRGRAFVNDSGASVSVPVFVALIENRLASGSLGVKECEKLASLFKVVAAKKSGIVLFFDSAGARVSEGLPALGAFRLMYRAALDAVASGASMAVYCGANCFGGASMLAALGCTRTYSANTRFAMSGPSILAQAIGVSALDDMFGAMSMAAISGEARARLGGAERMAADLASAAPPSCVTVSLAERHALLGERLAQLKPIGKSSISQNVERKDLAKLYPEGYRLQECNGVLTGEATSDGRSVLLAGFVGGQTLGAARAWAQADAFWKLHACVSRKPISAESQLLQVLVDCDSHSTSLDDERVMLSAYLADLSCSLHALASHGVQIETTVLGKLGGGVYVALCAPVAKVTMLYGTEIQLLPGRAIASILGETALQKHAFEEYRFARVADQELKLGIV